MAENKTGFGEALKSVSEIMFNIKRSEQGQNRADLKLAWKKIKQLKRELKKDGWEDWETTMYDDIVKSYGKQLKKLMTK